MIAMSAALAFGPAIDAAKSPERRVKMKLTTRTVRHTKAASHSLRTINKIIVEDYDSARVTARSDIDPSNGDIRICLCFLHMHATCSPICPKPTATTAALTVYELRSSLRTLVRNQRRDTAMECLSDACCRKNRQRGRGCTYPHLTTPLHEAKEA